MSKSMFRNVSTLAVAVMVLMGCSTATKAPEQIPTPVHATKAPAMETVQLKELINLKTSESPAGANSEISSVLSPATDKTVVPPSAGPKTINVTPLSLYSDDWQNAKPQDNKFADAYTHVRIQSFLHADSKDKKPDGTLVRPNVDDALRYEKRNWLMRSLVGSEFSINLTAGIKVGNLETVAPLVTIGHQSNSDGEQWSRSVHHDLSNFPWFLVKKDGSASVPQVRFSVKATNSYASRGAATALGVAVDVAKAISSPPSVLTKLTADSTKREAQAVDSAISKLFGASLTEEHWTDRDLSRWSIPKDAVRPSGVALEFFLPVSETDFNRREPPVSIGRWELTFEAPRPSIFSDLQLCDADQLRCKKDVQKARKEIAANLSPGEVLNFKLIPSNPELSTIRAYFTSVDWYASAITTFAGSADQATTQTAAQAFCRRVVNEIIGLGLNEFDGKAVLWAIYKGMPAKFPNLKASGVCPELLQDLPE